MTTLSRRSVLRSGAAACAAALLPRASFGEPARKIGISVQLYSIRDACAKDFDAALEQVAAMGFEGVEFAGYHHYEGNAAGLKKRLEACGLKAAATHIGTASFVGDALKKTIEFHKALGCKYLIVPGDGRFTSAEKSGELADIFNKAAEALKPEGLYCGYHNHTQEFQKSPGGKTWWDLFAERTAKDVVLQLDFGHAIYAGMDSAALVRASPGRVRTTHVKGRLPRGTQGKKPFVGQDTADWKAILGACYDVGGTEWFSIEQEDYPDGMSSMECTRISFEGLKAILKEMGK